MPKTFPRFKNLPVWPEAIRLMNASDDMAESKGWQCHYGLHNTIESTALPGCENIAEKVERGTPNELLMLLDIACESASVVRSRIYFRERWAGFADFKSQISNLKLISDSCSRQLMTWADHMQNLVIKRQRRLNSKSSQ